MSLCPSGTIRVEETEIIPEGISVRMGLGPLTGPVAEEEQAPPGEGEAAA